MTQLPEWRITSLRPVRLRTATMSAARPLSPDGLLAVWHPELGRVQVWKLRGNETSELSQTAGVFAVQKPVKILDEACLRDARFSPDSRQVAVQHPDLSIGVFDLATAKRIQRLAPVGGACRLAFNPRDRST